MNAIGLKTRWFAAVSVFFLVAGESTDAAFGGENKWTTLKKNVFKRSLDVLVVDPSDPGILYAAVGDTGVLKSVDGGKHWVLKNNGLRHHRIQKLVIDPFQPQTIYACTKDGLYRSADGGEQWQQISFFSQAAVNAIAVVPSARFRIYAAVDTDLYRSQDNGKTWQLIPDVPDTIHTAIYSIAASPTDTCQLYIGTEVGIFRIEDRQDTIKVKRGPDPWEQKTIDLAVDPFHTKAIFALFQGHPDTSGVYWAQEGWQWSELNNGFDKARFFPLRSLSLDPNHPRKLLAVNDRGGIFAYEFTFPQIGILDFTSDALPTWEIAAISQRVLHKLREHHSVKWLSRGELNAVDGLLFSSGQENSAQQLGRFFGLDVVISGEVGVQPDGIGVNRRELIRLKPQITFVNHTTTVGNERDTTIVAPRFDYMPLTADLIADWIYQHTDGKPSWLDRTFWRGSRKKLWLGGLSLFGLGYVLGSLQDRDDRPQQPTKLPLPPVFP